MPADQALRVDLEADALAKEIYDTRFRVDERGNPTIGFPTSPQWYESVVAVPTFQGDEMIELRNKIDLLPAEERQATRNAAARGTGAVAGPAVTGEGCDALLAEIEALLFQRRMIFTLRLGHGEGRAVSWLYGHGEVQGREDGEDGIDLTVEMTEKEFFQFQKEFGVAAAEVRQTARAAQ